MAIDAVQYYKIASPGKAAVHLSALTRFQVRPGCSTVKRQADEDWGKNRSRC
jgi:hypothetical protein